MKQQIDYKQYLASREWRVRRKEVIERNNNICERCASDSIQNVHHLTYERIGQESPSDLMGVCQPCHEYLAAERDTDPALEVIGQVISKHGLFPLLPWPNDDYYPTFSSGELNGRRLWMSLFCNDYRESFPGVPAKLIDDKTMAIFYWA